MTAGAGIVHSELPGPDFFKSGGVAHGFQIWVNLPARVKFATPGYQYLPAREIPTAESPDGKVRVTVIAGEALGVQAGIGTHTPIWLQDWHVQAGADIEIALDETFNAAAYVFHGAVGFGSESTDVQQGQMAVFGAGDSLRITGTETGGRFLLLAGEPIGEPVAWHGPFVMNTEEELRSAIDDYRRGRMGVIDRA